MLYLVNLYAKEASEYLTNQANRHRFTANLGLWNNRSIQDFVISVNMPSLKKTNGSYPRIFGVEDLRFLCPDDLLQKRVALMLLACTGYLIRIWVKTVKSLVHKVCMEGENVLNCVGYTHTYTSHYTPRNLCSERKANFIPNAGIEHIQYHQETRSGHFRVCYFMAISNSATCATASIQTNENSDLKIFKIVQLFNVSRRSQLY